MIVQRFPLITFRAIRQLLPSVPGRRTPDTENRSRKSQLRRSSLDKQPLLFHLTVPWLILSSRHRLHRRAGTDSAKPDPPPEPPPHGDNPTVQSTGLPSNIAAALACIPLVGGLIFWFLEKHDNFVRFYAMQSIIFGGVWVLFNIISRVVFDIFGSIPALGAVLVFLWAIIQALVHLGFLVIMVIAMIKAFSGSRWDIPYIGPMARKYVSE